MGNIRGLAAAAVLGLGFLTAWPVLAQETLPEFEGLDADKRAEAEQFVLSNALFVLFHEGGHMLVSEFGLPVLGREEDAVDSLSTLVLLGAESDELDNALVDAADGWFMSGEGAEAAGQEYAFWDEHAIDQQRAYAIICLMVGKDADRFGEIAESSGMPPERVESCPGDYEQALGSWSSLLDPHAQETGESEIEVVYDPAPTELEPYAAVLQDADILGMLKTAIADAYQLEPGIVFQATSCGEENAFWDGQTRTMTFCYELVRLHAGLIAKALQEGQ